MEPEEVTKALARFAASKSLSRMNTEISQATERWSRALTSHSGLIVNAAGELALVQSKIGGGSKRLGEQMANYATNLEKFTAGLEAGQLSRVNRVVEDWHTQVNSPTPPQKRGFLTRLQELLFAKRRRRRSFADYLVGAHTHPAVARQDGKGRRRWFEAWRREALALLRLGLDPLKIVALQTSIAAPARRRNELRPAPRPADVFNNFITRIRTVIAPNAPGPSRLHRFHGIGDGPTPAA